MGTGYLPDVAISSDGTLGVVYYAPSQGDSHAEIRVVRNQGEGWNIHSTLNTRPPKFIHFRTHGEGADDLPGVPRIAAHEGLFLAAWVRGSASARERDQIAVSRAALPGAEVKRIEIIARNPPIAHKVTTVDVRCVNEYGVTVQGCEDGVSIVSGGVRYDDVIKEVNGQQTVWVTAGRSAVIPSSQGDSGGLVESAYGTGLATVTVQTSKLAELAQALPTKDGARPGLRPISANATGNYLRAELQRDALFSADLGAQREYAYDPENEDSEFLAGYDRVWAYTQGIALAQFARQDDSRAGDVAVFLCENARRASNGTKILGWPFSWNTVDDDWYDARLVTGANAWAVHGLGVFVSSRQFAHLSGDRQGQLRACYVHALEGLKDHIHAPTGLMTAGYTTRGLETADAPGKMGIKDEHGEVYGPDISFEYYDVLDVVGYDRFDSERAPTIKTYRTTGGQKERLGFHAVTASDFTTLKKRVVAQNIVTEHNLDVLSVLNHALSEWDHIFASAPADREELRASLLPWRDRLREAIFTELWDETQKRFVTGGEISDAGSFVQSKHSAVDNCSWLSLSVDYSSLPQAHRTKLAECLDYTLHNFTRELPFSGKTYYGAHYFPNGFVDKYIEANGDQARLYHIEATTGLIMGLLRFVDTAPSTEDFAKRMVLAGFERRARELWAEMQRFVEDHDFPYSSLRIHNLMAKLDSSTALIWFIDVYDYMAKQHDSVDRPLKDYAEETDMVAAAASTLRAMSRLENMSGDFDEDKEASEAGSRGQLLSSWNVDANPEEAALTLIEDQALAVIAAASRGHFTPALSWIQGLFHTLHGVDFDGEVISEFPWLVHSRNGVSLNAYRQTGPQMLAIYADAFLSRRLQDEGLEPLSMELSFGVLEGLVKRYLDIPSGLLLSGSGNPLARGSETDSGALQPLPVAFMRDHLYAYFALREMAPLLDEKQRAFAHELQMSMKRRLDETFWDPQSNKPLQAVKVASDGTLEAVGGSAGAASLYTLYAIHTGQVQRARRCLDILAFSQDEGDRAASASEGRFSPTEGVFDFAQTDAALILAWRAGAMIDPRHEQLALRALTNVLDELPETVGGLAGTLLADTPGGFLGLDAAPMFYLVSGRGPLVLTEEVDDRLTSLFYETLFSLLASDYREYVFNDRFEELIRILHVVDMVRNAVPQHEWGVEFEARTAQERTASTVHGLLNFCGLNVSALSPRPSPSTPLGLSCQEMSRVSGMLFEKRTKGETPTFFISILSAEIGDAAGDLDMRALQRIAAYLQAPSGWASGDSQQGIFLGYVHPHVGSRTKRTSMKQFPMSGHAAEMASDASLDDVAEWLRNDWMDGVRQLVSDPIRDGEKVRYELRYVDLIAIENTASPVFWSREAIELRDLDRWEAERQSFRFTLNGLDTDLSTEDLHSHTKGNVRPLRRFINTFAEGRLSVMAKKSGFSVPVLHAMMRTGALTEDEFQRMSNGFSLSDKEAEVWAEQFSFVSPGSPSRTFAWSPVFEPIMLHRSMGADDQGKDDTEELEGVGLHLIKTSVGVSTHWDGETARIAFEEEQTGCRTVVDVRSTALSANQFFNLPLDYLERQSKLVCDMGNEYTQHLQSNVIGAAYADGEDHVFVFGPENLDLSQWASLISAGHVQLAVIGEAPKDAQDTGSTVSPETTSVTFAKDVEIPSWIKSDAILWEKGLISDGEFFKGIELLIANEILIVPSIEGKTLELVTEIPVWVKTNAGWWASNQISDDEFLKGIQFLIEEGIIQIASERKTTSETEALPGLSSIEFVPSPYLSWCDDESCVSEPTTVYACSKSGGCSLTHSFNLEWTINGRSFEGLWLHDAGWASVDEYDDRAVISQYNDKRFRVEGSSHVLIRGDLPEMSLTTSYASKLSSGSSKLEYKGYGFKTRRGKVFVTYLPAFETKVPAELEAQWEGFDDIAEKISKAAGLEPQPYELHFVPSEMMRDLWGAGEYHGSNRISLNRYVPHLGEIPEDRPGVFAHEYGHLVIDKKIPRENVDQRVRFSCLGEGIAEAVEAYAQGTWDDGTFPSGCAHVGYWHSKGQCVLWQAYHQGYRDEEYIHGLLNPNIPLHFDSCAFGEGYSNTTEIGNAYIVYLSEAAKKDLTAVVDAAGIDHAGSYLSAKAAHTDWLKKNGHCVWPWDCQVPEELKSGR